MSRKVSTFIFPWAASAVGVGMSHVSAASSALQTSAVSTVLLMLSSAGIAVVPIAVVYCDARFLSKNHRYNWSRLAGFPAVWASTWGVISMLMPTGRLLMWSPVTGLGPYTWISSYLGPWGIDFVVASWSVVLTEAIAIPLSQHALSMQDPDYPRNVERVAPYDDNPDEPTTRDHSTLWYKSAFTLFLLTLTMPSLWTPLVPNPTYITTTTPFSLGCVLPQTHLPHRTPHSPTLDDYITETKKMTNAKLVLWPESALKFDNEEQRNKTFETIFTEVLKNRKGFHVGVGFEERAPESWNKRASKRNGFALLVDDQVVLQYYKRHLVPSKEIPHLEMAGSKAYIDTLVAESFSMIPSDEEPALYELPLGPPSGTRRSDWAARPNYTRPIPITSSICLDFASQSAFLSLDSRPALILAPARTWHPSVGLAMWNHARQRAHETGSTILWCDGGEGGLSGVIGGGFEEPLQFGEGSWIKTVGLTHPFSERKTAFTSRWVGNFGAFIIVWIVAGGGGFAIQAAAAVSRDRRSLFAWNVVKARRVAHGLAGLLRGNQPSDVERGEERRLIREAALLDLDDEEQEQHHQQTPMYGAAQHA